MLLAGCGGGEFTPQSEFLRIHPALLLSELRSPSDAGPRFDPTTAIDNPGAEPVELRYDGSGCSCYGLIADGRPLKSGATITMPPRGRLELRFDVRPPEAPGEFQFTASFARLRPEQPEQPFRVRLSVPVVADAALTPELLTVGYRPGEPIAAVPLRITRAARDRQRVARPPQLAPLPPEVTASAWREATLEQRDAGLWQSQHETDFHVALPESFRDDLQASIVIQPFADDAAATTAPELHCRMLIQPRVGLRGPKSIAFGALTSGGQPRQRRLLLAAVDGLAFRILSADSDHPDCRATLDAGDPDVRQWLTVELTPRAAGEIQAAIACRTDHPESPLIAIDVTARVAAAQ